MEVRACGIAILISLAAGQSCYLELVVLLLFWTEFGMRMLVVRLRDFCGKDGWYGMVCRWGIL